MKSAITTVMAVSMLLGAACGGGENGNDDLAIYAGEFTVVETFKEQNGSSCPTPTQPYENELIIEIEKSDIEADFDTRWGVLYGQINSDGSFLASDNQNNPDLELQFTGEFVDENGFGANMRENMPGCVRWTSMTGDRILQE